MLNMAWIRVEDVPARVVAVVRAQLPAAGAAALLGSSAATIEAAVLAAGGVVAGPLFAWYHAPLGADAPVSVGVAVVNLGVGDLGDVDVVRRPGGLAAVALHVGPYDALADTHRELDVWLNDRQLDPAEEFWEEYLSDPEADPDPTTWETRLVRPLT